MRICQLVNNLDSGGLEKIALCLHNHNYQNNKQSYFVCIDGQGSLYSDLISPEANHLVLNKSKIKLINKLPIINLLKLRAFIKTNRIDIVHAHNWAALIYISNAIIGLPNKPRIVFTEHNQINRATAAECKKFYRYLRKADERLLVSKALKVIYEEHYGSNLTTKVMYNGVDPSKFNIESKHQSTKSELLKVNDDDFVIGTAAVLSAQKGLHFFLESAKVVTDLFPNVKFIIAGDGPLRVELESLSHELGLTDKVNFLGYQNNVEQIIKHFDVVLMTSLWEGLPLSLIEGLAMGKPIVASDVGGNKEVVESGINGFIVPPRNVESITEALIAIYEDQDGLSKYEKVNVDRFTKLFSLPTMLQNHQDLYEQLL